MVDDYKATLSAQDTLTPALAKATQSIEKLIAAIETMGARFDAMATKMTASAQKVGSATASAASQAQQASARVTRTYNAQGQAVQSVVKQTTAGAGTMTTTLNQYEQVVKQVSAQSVSAQDAAGLATNKWAQQTGNATRSVNGQVVETNKQMQRMSHGFVESVAYMVKSMAVWAAASAVLAIALSPIAAAFATLQLAKRAAEVDGITRSFHYLSQTVGETSETMLTDMRKASAGAIADTQLMKNANLTIATMGKQGAAQVSKLMQIARAAAAAYGRDINETYTRLVEGIAKQEQELLDELGIRARATEAYKKYAAQVGKTTEQLSQQERVQAFLNEVLLQGDALIARVGGGNDDMAASFGRIGAQVQNVIDIVGSALAPAFQQAAQSIGGVVEAAANLARKAAPYLWAWANAVAEGLGVASANWADGLNNLADTVDEWLPTMLTNGTNLAINFAQGIVNGIGAVVGAVATLIGAVSSLLEAHSPPEKGPFHRIREWGAGLINEYIEGFSDADYGKVELAATNLSKEVKDKFGKIGKDIQRMQSDWMKTGMNYVSKSLADQVRDKTITKEQAMAMYWPAMDALQKASQQLRQFGKVDDETVGQLRKAGLKDYADLWLLVGENSAEAMKKLIGLNTKAAEAEETYRRQAAALIHLDPRFKDLVPQEVWMMSDDDKQKWLDGQREAADAAIDAIEDEMAAAKDGTDSFKEFAEAVLQFQESVSDIKVTASVDLKLPEDLKLDFGKMANFDPFQIYREGLEDIDGSVLTPFGKKLEGLKAEWSKLWDPKETEGIRTGLQGIGTDLNAIATNLGDIVDTMGNLGKEWDKLPPGIRDFIIGYAGGAAVSGGNPAVSTFTGISNVARTGTAETIPAVPEAKKGLEWWSDMLDKINTTINGGWVELMFGPAFAAEMRGEAKANLNGENNLFKMKPSPTLVEQASDEPRPTQGRGSNQYLERYGVDAKALKIMYDELALPEDKQLSIFDSIKKPFEDAWNALVGGRTVKVGDTGGTIPTLITNISEGFSSLLTWLGDQKSAFALVAADLFTSFGNAAIYTFNILGTSVTTAFGQMVTSMVKTLNNMIAQYNGLADQIGQPKLPEMGDVVFAPFPNIPTMHGGGIVPKLMGLAETPIIAKPGERVYAQGQEPMGRDDRPANVNIFGNIYANDEAQVNALVNRVLRAAGKKSDSNIRLGFGRKQYGTT